MRVLTRIAVALLLPMALAALRAQSPAPGADASGRLILVSLDGMGTQLFREDPVSEELQALRALRERGVMADGVVSHMPSTTANTHAALWTGAWGDVNGITSNDMPLAPRSDNLIGARLSGYRSEGLRAEPVWVAAARQGVRSVAQQATQVYPLVPRVTGGSLATPPVLLHGYQAQVVAPARWLTASDMTPVQCQDAGAITCVGWQSGPVPFTGTLRRSGEALLLDIRVAGSSRTVSVRMAPTEAAPPRGRELARHFSDGLLVDVPGQPPVMAYFRLFEAAPDGRSMLLFQSVLQEVVLYPGRAASRAESMAFLEVAGGFIGNGDDEPWETAGASGVSLYLGGDGTRERRYLETLELGIRQTIRHAEYLWRTHRPRLLVGYVSMPDELDHAWLGHARVDARYAALRRWGYQLVDRAVSTYAGFATAADHVLFTSDHGMAPITHEVRVNQVLRDAGLVTVDRAGRPDPARSQVVFTRNCLIVHTDDWKGGVVPVGQRDVVLARAVSALQAVRDPDGGAVITAALTSAADRERLGFGGPNGHDACFDVRPGYQMSTWMDEGPVVRVKARPTGEHGFLPTRPDMQGILIAAGPRLPRGGDWPRQRAIDVAPLVSDLLGITPPRDARGRSPLRP